MGKNANLHTAKRAKQDEFYTTLSDIEKEVTKYREYFKNKTVFLNCDDPEESNFWRYFELNFEFLGLKKLVSTHYETDKPSYKLELFADVNGDGKINKGDIVKTDLKQNGDFRSPECVEILKECDVVVTNPPFSLFREYLAQLMEYEKKFLIIGNQNAITYKETFKHIKENKLWLGYTMNGSNRWFIVPDDYEYKSNAKHRVNGDGKREIFVNGVVWFTNLPISKPIDDMKLYLTYEEGLKKGLYLKYENYDAINVDKVSDIPIDYDGVIGVPITFLHKYQPNLDEFEIVKFRKGDDDKDLIYSKLGGGVQVQPYFRILIRKCSK